MLITTKAAGKRFNYDWILRDVNLELSSGNTYNLKGPNGSGKSTLLKMMSGLLSPSEGSITWADKDGLIDVEAIYKKVGISAPYMELPEELNLLEIISFHTSFKSLVKNFTPLDIIEILELNANREKPLSAYSSGMKQRVKLGLAILSNNDLIILDEPATNLDENAIKWFHALLDNYLDKRLLLVASNRQDETRNDAIEIDINSFK